MRDSNTKVLRIVGVVLLLASSLSLGTEWVARRDRADAMRLSQLPDPEGRASAAYHCALAEANLAARRTRTRHGASGVLRRCMGDVLLCCSRRPNAT